MNKMDFLSQLKTNVNTVNEWLIDLAPKGEGAHKHIYESANYSVNIGGKRIRPVIAIEVCKMLGGDISNVKHFACALEFIHTYSLIHDDLPCMDNDDLRRGKPTNHKVYGEAMAVLAGDGLLTYAFLVASNSSCENKVEAILNLAKLSGFDGMIGGQVIDMDVAKDEKTLLELHSRKTGTLICASAKLGAIAANASESDTEKVIEYAKNLGMAFQIKDDLLDVLGDEKTLGKPIGSDKNSNKKTFVDFYGIDGAKSKLLEYNQKAKESISYFGEKCLFLTQLVDYLTDRNN